MKLFPALMLVCCGTAAFGADKKEALIDAMNESGCKMTPEQANRLLPGLEIDRQTAIALSREMMAEGIASFADDEETLLLLPPACKS